MRDYSNSEFREKVVVITGAGGGLGKAHALEFAKRGAFVVINDLGGSIDGTGAGDAADLVVQEIEDKGGKAIANKASVSSIEGAKSIVDDALSAFGRIDILVNNAGILRDRTFKKMTLSEWDLVVDVHLNGSAYVTHAAWPHMIEQKYGRVIFTSSGTGLYGNFGQANYGAAKMGMVGFMNVLALEGARSNVHVNTLAPGAATRMMATIPGEDFDADNPPADRAPKLVSPAVLFMASEEAPNGVIINAMNGSFSRAQIFANQAIDLGVDVEFEDLMKNREALLDLKSSNPRALGQQT